MLNVEYRLAKRPSLASVATCKLLHLQLATQPPARPQDGTVVAANASYRHDILPFSSSPEPSKPNAIIVTILFCLVSVHLLHFRSLVIHAGRPSLPL